MKRHSAQVDTGQNSFQSQTVSMPITVRLVKVTCGCRSSQSICRSPISHILNMVAAMYMTLNVVRDRPVGTPNRLNLKAFERECEFVAVHDHKAGERNSQIIPQSLFADFIRQPDRIPVQ